MSRLSDGSTQRSPYQLAEYPDLPVHPFILQLPVGNVAQQISLTGQPHGVRLHWMVSRTAQETPQELEKVHSDTSDRFPVSYLLRDMATCSIIVEL